MPRRVPIPKCRRDAERRHVVAGWCAGRRLACCVRSTIFREVGSVPRERLRPRVLRRPGQARGVAEALLEDERHVVGNTCVLARTVDGQPPGACVLSGPRRLPTAVVDAARRIDSHLEGDAAAARGRRVWPCVSRDRPRIARPPSVFVLGGPASSPSSAADCDPHADRRPRNATGMAKACKAEESFIVSPDGRRRTRHRAVR